MNILTNGGTVCLSTHSNELLTIPVFNNGAGDVTNVTVTIVIPAGLTVNGDTPSQGSYAAGVWDVGALTTLQDESNPETLELCFEIADETLAPFIITWTITCTECPDPNPEDDAGSRTIEGIQCNELGDCFNATYAALQEFDSMDDAVTALGEGQPFLASLLNIEGWSYRAVLVTPFS